MDIKSINRSKDYSIADISDEDIKNITKLEQSLKSKTNQDIVLIAYQKRESRDNLTFS